MEKIVPLISVIIPVFNVERYLHKCVDSVLCQQVSSIEVILVDDGSSDSCPRICDEYALKDPRVKVIHKKNGGSSDARNYGINNASGEYIMFLDSDDYWEGNNCLQNIFSSIKNREPDVILYGCKDYYWGTDEMKLSRSGYDIEYLRNHTTDENVKKLFESELFPGAAWLVVVKKSCILNNHIYFEQGIKAEDYDWLINLFLHINTMDAVSDTFYIYLKGRNDSVTGTSDVKSIQSLMFIIDKWYPILNKQFLLRNVYLLNLLSFIFITSLVIYSKLGDENKKKIFQKIKSRDYILNYAKTKKVKLLSFLYRFLGMNLMSSIIRLKSRK